MVTKIFKECEKMLTKMNFRSKKGLSLAVALTICLFMILVTGGITTIALLQQKETGSNMNTRQAYISAKSGLDTMQDALEEKFITDLPSTMGGDGYYVMYIAICSLPKMLLKTFWQI